jgi:serine/threonine protein kinase
MAPEMFVNQGYSGVHTDMFACGVILFCMLFGRPPFKSASPEDPYYKFIASNNIEKFW